MFGEDCDFLFDTPGAVNDSYMGGRFVFRYNNMQNCGFQTHPTGGSGRARGSRAWEVYRNTVTSTTNNFNWAFISSGTGVVHHNNFLSSNYSNFITLHAMRRDNSTYMQTATPNGWGFAGTSFNGTGSNWDGNSDVPSGYPNIDMIGRGIGDLLSGEFPNAINVTNGNATSASPNAWPRQALDPFYQWENNWSNPGMGGSKMAVYEGDTILENRDFYNDTAKPGYTEYTYPHELVTLLIGEEGEGGEENPDPPDPPIPPDPEPSPSPVVTVEMAGTVGFKFALPQEILDYLRAALNDKE